MAGRRTRPWSAHGPDVATLIGATASEIVFTGCATEANNLAIFGVAKALRTQRKHIITPAIEHPAVLQPFLRLEHEEWDVTILPVDGDARVHLGALDCAIRDARRSSRSCELLCQGEKSVEMLALQADLNVKSASTHLKELKAARLVCTRKEGKYVRYRLADEGVARFWVTLRHMAEERLVELQQVEREFLSDLQHPAPLDRRSLLIRARQGEVIVLDVRPADEFNAAHLPFARSMPLPEMKKRLKELPRNRDIVAYCRGPFGLLANDAVALLRRKGFRAGRLADGVAEWRAAGLPIESDAASR